MIINHPWFPAADPAPVRYHRGMSSGTKLFLGFTWVVVGIGLAILAEVIGASELGVASLFVIVLGLWVALHAEQRKQ
jgi:hypothetical protein